jgi:hypothetical protein
VLVIFKKISHDVTNTYRPVIAILAHRSNEIYERVVEETDIKITGRLYPPGIIPSTNF